MYGGKGSSLDSYSGNGYLLPREQHQFQIHKFKNIVEVNLSVCSIRVTSVTLFVYLLFIYYQLYQLPVLSVILLPVLLVSPYYQCY